METLLAIVVASAVIFFGALISMGNERQRRAIDGLREQVVLWAVQDLKLKKEYFTREVLIRDPLDWLNKMATTIVGYDLDLQIVESFDSPQSLVCTSGKFKNKIVFSPLSPNDMNKLKRNQKARLTKFSTSNILYSLPRAMISYELTILNCGILFDIELSQAWKKMTNQEISQTSCLWMYIGH